ncbi:MAG: UDP-N-acetylmuramoyl-L-alanine--D-glutamate ligase, partial [Bacillota bacterium]
MHLEGKKVAVVGLGVSNLALVHFLLRRGALVTVLDQKPTEELAERLQELPAGRVRTVLGPG